MRSSAVVFVMMVVATMGFFASGFAAESELGIALPSDAIAAEIITEAEEIMLKRKEDKKQHPIGEAEWPCCDHCGICDPEHPLNCTCWDVRVRGCHPGCKDCRPIPCPPLCPAGIIRYVCVHWITNFCERKCTIE